MLKTSFNVLIIVLVFFGMIVLMHELYHHLRKTKPLSKDSFWYKCLLFVIGLDILVEKTIAVINDLS